MLLLVAMPASWAFRHWLFASPTASSPPPPPAWRGRKKSSTGRQARPRRAAPPPAPATVLRLQPPPTDAHVRQLIADLLPQRSCTPVTVHPGLRINPWRENATLRRLGPSCLGALRQRLSDALAAEGARANVSTAFSKSQQLVRLSVRPEVARAMAGFKRGREPPQSLIHAMDERIPPVHTRAGVFLRSVGYGSCCSCGSCADAASATIEGGHIQTEPFADPNAEGATCASLPPSLLARGVTLGSGAAYDIVRGNLQRRLRALAASRATTSPAGGHVGGSSHGATHGASPRRERLRILAIGGSVTAGSYSTIAWHQVRLRRCLPARTLSLLLLYPTVCPLPHHRRVTLNGATSSLNDHRRVMRAYAMHTCRCSPRRLKRCSCQPLASLAGGATCRPPPYLTSTCSQLRAWGPATCRIASAATCRTHFAARHLTLRSSNVSLLHLPSAFHPLAAHDASLHQHHPLL